MIKCCFYFLVFVSINKGFFYNQEPEKSDWVLSKSKNQISIYLRTVDYSSYKEFKGEMIVKSCPENIITFLTHIESFEEWLPDCKESKKLTQISNTEQINYVLTEVPWPYEDRDITYLFKVMEKNSNTGKVIIQIENRPEFIPFRNNTVRIPRSAGIWTFTPINKDYTKVEYQMHIEPGGFVPAWLANLKIVDTPYTFLYNLREQIEKQR